MHPALRQGGRTQNPAPGPIHAGGLLPLPHCPYPRLGERKLSARILARTSVPRAAAAQQSEHARVEAAGATFCPHGTCSPPPHTLTHPPCLYALSLSDLDLAAGALAWVPLRALQPRAGGPVAPLVSPLHAIIRPAPLHAAPFVRGARLAALRRAFSSAPCPPRPNKRRAP